MNNFFNVLWYDDDNEWVKTTQRDLADLLKDEYCLKLEVDYHKNAEIEEESLKSNKYDLILMDYKLDDSTINGNGDFVIGKIREMQVLTDIIFYSSEQEKMQKALIDKLPEGDGVYMSKRDNEIFSGKVQAVIKKIVRRSEDIVNLRGMVLDATSEIEDGVKDLLSEMWGGLDENAKQKINDLAKKQLTGFINKKKEKVAEYEELKTCFENENQDSGAVSMNDRLTILQKYGESQGIPIKINGKKILEYYLENLGAFRNKLGHVEKGKKIEVYGNSYTINDDFHKLMRSRITDMKTNFLPFLRKSFSVKKMS